MADLVALKARLRDLERQVAEARADYSAALIEASGIKVGDEVEARFWSNEDFQPVIVRNVTVRYDNIRVTASTRNKGGEYSKAWRETDAIRKADGTEVKTR